MFSDNIDTLGQSLEKQELENACNGTSVSPTLYSQLLAVYLYQNDLCNAKYLWKRIPSSVKTSNRELQNIWKVGQMMWRRNFPGIYTALNEPWSPTVADIMANLKDKIQTRAAHLVGTAYSSLSLDALAAFTGLKPEEAAKKGAESGWQLEGDGENKVVKPLRPSQVNMYMLSCEDQLSKLTDFVSFLEN